LFLEGYLEIPLEKEFQMKKSNEVVKVVVDVVKESAKDLLIYAGVGMAVMKTVQELGKAKDYFDKK